MWPVWHFTANDTSSAAEPDTPKAVELPQRRARRWSLPWLGGIAIALVMLVGVQPLMALPQQAPNSRVVLDLPPGYQPSPLFAGFQNEETGVSFVILEVPLKAYDELAAGFTSAELSKRGLTDAEKASLPRGEPYVYMRARQKSQAGDYAKFFVLFRTEDQTVLISTNVPATLLDSGTIKPADIERVLASAHTVGATAVKNLYKLGYVGPFREAGSFVGTSRLYTLDGHMEPETNAKTRPALVIAPSLDHQQVEDPAALASKLLISLTGYSDVRTRTSRKLTIGGLPAIEVEAEATDPATGSPVSIYQGLIYPPKGGYFRLVGITGPDTTTTMMPEFRKIAQSFELTLE